MCRLFGMLSAKSCEPSGFLFEDERSLLRQSNADPERLHAEGWGIAYLGDEMKVMKSAGAVFNEVGLFRDAVRNIDSRLILAHLRWASNPRGLDSSEMLGVVNVQPYQTPGLAFIHNGTVNFPDSVDLGKYRGEVKGRNDSENLFWLLVRHLEEQGDVDRALIAVERSLFESAPEGKDPFTGINMIFTDGQVLYAYCRYLIQDTTALCSKERGYYTMCYLSGADSIVVMSEPSDDDAGWRDMGNGELLTARIAGDDVALSVRKIL